VREGNLAEGQVLARIIVNALDGSGQLNLTNTGAGVHDAYPERGGQAKKK
jgi:hypothetical protein